MGMVLLKTYAPREPFQQNGIGRNYLEGVRGLANFAQSVSTLFRIIGKIPLHNILELGILCVGTI